MFLRRYKKAWKKLKRHLSFCVACRASWKTYKLINKVIVHLFWMSLTIDRLVIDYTIYCIHPIKCPRGALHFWGKVIRDNFIIPKLTPKHLLIRYFLCKLMLLKPDTFAFSKKILFNS